jgi:hypothetical protein
MPENLPWNQAALAAEGHVDLITGGHNIQCGYGATGAPLGSPRIGIYSLEERRERVARFLEKRQKRVWTRKVKYDVRKNFADSRIRFKGRFVKKEEEVDILTVGSTAAAAATGLTGSSASAPKARRKSVSKASGRSTPT